MKNAKEEFIKHVMERTVICAAISIEDEDGEDKKYFLKLNHTDVLLRNGRARVRSLTK